MAEYRQDPDNVKLVPLGEDYRGPNGRLGYLLRIAYQAMRAAIDQVAREHDLTLPQYAIINILYREPGLTGAGIARQSMLRAQTVNEIMQLLERRGLVRRQSTGRDQRIKLGYLTAAGRKVFERVDVEVARIEERAIQGSTATERHGLFHGLMRCALVLGQNMSSANSNHDE